MESNYVFVFIHGAYHGAWCFDKYLTPIFHKHNYKTITFDLPGSGNDFSPEEDITLENYVDKTISVIKSQTKECENIVLVAHSLGGLTATLVAETIPERVHCVIYLTAFYLQNGQNIYEMAVKNASYLTEDQKYMTINDEDLKETLYHDCNDEVIKFAKANFRNQYLKPVFERLTVQGTIDGLKKCYIHCLGDAAIPPEVQKLMYKGRIANVVEMDTCHCPFFSKPDELFNIIIKQIK